VQDKQPESGAPQVINYKLQPPGYLCVSKPSMNYIVDDLKSNSRFLSKKRIDYEIFKAEDSIDLLIIGTDASGKSTLIKSMTEDEKFFMTAGTKVNDIIRMDIDGFQIMARELSYAYMPSWERYLPEAKILVVGFKSTSLL
jgi:predicted GTPase